MALAEYPKPNFPDFMAAEIALWMENIPPEDVTPIVVDVKDGNSIICDPGGRSLLDALRGTVRTYLAKDVTPHPYKLGVLVIGGGSRHGFIVPLHAGSTIHHVMTKKRKLIVSYRRLLILAPPLTINVSANSQCKPNKK